MIAFTLKEKTKSLNQSFRGDWRARAGTAKRQRDKAMKACPKWTDGPLLCIRLTRVSPGKLDDDAVPAALKHVRDGVAARLRVDDASELVRWTYEQASGDAAVVVQIWKYASDDTPAKVPDELASRRLHPPARDARSDGFGRTVRALRTASAKAPRPAYTRPRTISTAAREAEETFAPAPCPYPTCSGDCEHAKP